MFESEPELVYVDMKNIDLNKSLKTIDNLNYIENDNLVSNKLRPLIDPIDKLPDVQMDIFDKKNFLRPFNGKIVGMADFELSRGCWYRCTFYLILFKEKQHIKAKNFRREKSIQKIIRNIDTKKKSQS